MNPTYSPSMSQKKRSKARSEFPERLNVHANGTIAARTSNRLNIKSLTDIVASSTERNNIDTKSNLFQLMIAARLGIAGSLFPFASPFGTRRLVFCDWVASAKPFLPIENFLQSNVHPYYANTHTQTSQTGIITSAYREQARQVIMNHCKADNYLYAGIFAGSGVTGAVHKLIAILRLRESTKTNKDHVLVLVGPYEHHSNILPWRETKAHIENIPLNSSGGICSQTLTKILVSNTRKDVIIGAFSACSNVSGIITPEEEMININGIIHSYGGMAFWDFAAAAPYVEINLASTKSDAIFISTHKALGGPNTPGFLIVSRSIIEDESPSSCGIGGGTVEFVTDYGEKYVDDVVHREEGGTQDILGSIRAGLVFQLKEMFGIEFIRSREHLFWKRIKEELSVLKDRIEILGFSFEEVKQIERVSTLSFLVRSSKDRTRFLHYNYVSALMNDMFGIQCRGGCMCAGPYGQKLLGISERNVNLILEQFESCTREAELLKPGFTRLSVNYFASDDELEYVLESLKFIVRHGEKLMHLYDFDEFTGDWRYIDSFPPTAKLQLDASVFNTIGQGSVLFSKYEELQHCQRTYFTKTRREANQILMLQGEKSNQAGQMVKCRNLEMDQIPGLRWFVLPRDEPAMDMKELEPLIDPRRYHLDYLRRMKAAIIEHELHSEFDL